MIYLPIGTIAPSFSVFRGFRFRVTPQKISSLMSRSCSVREFELLSENRRRLSTPLVNG
jgi:hypothetical protein